MDTDYHINHFLTHKMRIVGIRFGDELPKCLIRKSKCVSKFEIIMEDKNSNIGMTFCFPISEPTLAVVWKQNDNHLKLTYRNGIQCCLSDEQFYAENGFIDLVLRIEISQDGDYVGYVSNYKSLLNIIDANFNTQVNSFTYIDFKISNF